MRPSRNLLKAAALGVVVLLSVGVLAATSSRSADSSQTVTGAVSSLAAPPLISSGGPEIIVYKSPTCGCCGRWVEHMRANGYAVVARDTSDMGAIKERYGVGRELQSCHTSIVAGYVVEGHVPAADVRRLLAERPAVAGVAAPGMPAGSPGMEGPRADRYDVLTFDRAGRTAVFSSH